MASPSKLDTRISTRPLAAPVGPPMEHRFGKRYACGARVQIASGAGIAGAGRLSNVSLSGAYIQTGLKLPTCALVSVTKLRADDHRSIELQASVVRSDAGGFAVEWCETPACSICQLLGCPRPCRPD
jgi:hypothetical protein